jgi:hypothetical protein
MTQVLPYNDKPRRSGVCCFDGLQQHLCSDADGLADALAVAAYRRLGRCGCALAVATGAAALFGVAVMVLMGCRGAASGGAGSRGLRSRLARCGSRGLSSGGGGG